ncbi:hypothetical protein FRC09_019670, partial [Ceratobasidium sp. 395]
MDRPTGEARRTKAAYRLDVCGVGDGQKHFGADSIIISSTSTIYTLLTLTEETTLDNRIMSSLTAARYGKDKVRVFRIVRDGDKHTVVEYIVRALLEGNIATSYTQADNSVVVATDSIKNTCYVIAKTSPHVLSPELYALHLGAHFVTKYPHIHKAFIDIEQLKWTRIDVEGTPHKHSFVRDGEEKIVVKVEVDATAGKDKASATVEAGIKDLLVLKSTGSAFEGFIRDEYTTLL